jgi:hypothetical protein
MPGGWNVGWQLANATSLASAYVTVTSSATINTKGTWTQISASTPSDCSWMLISTGNSGGNHASVDIGFGAAASERILVADIVVGSFAIGINTNLLLPISVPAGTRIAARTQAKVASSLMLTLISTFDDAFGSAPSPNSSFDTLGFVSSTTLGTAVDPGATASTKGAWVQLSASLTNDLNGFFLCFDVRGATNGTVGGGFFTYVDVGIGASGSEKVILSNFMVPFYMITGVTMCLPGHTPYFPIPIRAGQRLAVRAASDTNVSPDRIVGVTFYGGRQ